MIYQFWSALAYGSMSQTNKKVLLKTQTTTARTDEIDEFKTNNNSLQIGFQSHTYLQSSDAAAAQENSFQLQYKFNFVNGSNLAKTDVIFGGYVQNSFLYAAIPQLYYQHSLKLADHKESDTFSYGRKIIDVSRLDSTFNLGLINVLFTQDFLSFQSQGLTGFFNEYQSRLLGLEVGLLPIYLPNQEPSVKDVDGRLVSSNRWVKKPPSQFAFNNQNKEIIYSVNYNKVNKLIFSSGALALVRVGEVKNNIHWVGSFSKRPLNELVLERETYADLDVVGKVNLIPNILYSDIFTSDLRFDTEKLKSSLSYISDYPENKTAQDFYSIQTLSPISGFSISMQYELDIFKQRTLELGFAAAEFKGGEITDINFDGSENIFTFSKQRLQYKQPVQLSVASDIFSFSHHPLVSRLKWLYDREQQGTVFSTEVSLKTWASLTGHLGLDILGTVQHKTEDIGFIQQFQANDRVYGGLEYVF